MRPILVCLVAVLLASSSYAADAPCRRKGGEIEEAILGFQQTGASAAAHTQSYFFDFYISRPFPIVRDPCESRDEIDQLYGPRARWWGNVRVSSYPQQVTAPVATFVADFPGQVKSLPVNKLAQSAEFVTGLEWRFMEFGHALDGNDRDERQLFALSVFGGGGATGALDPPETLQIFETPAKDSPQYPRFAAAFPDAANSPYVGFIAPDRDRFYRQFSAGLRLTTMYVKKGLRGQPDEPYLAAPALISVSLGRNEIVTRGRMEGVVGRFEAFYPLLLYGERSERAAIIYLFGTAMLRLGDATQTTPFVLRPAPQIQGFESEVAIVPLGSNRDTYLIGVGIDLAHLIRTPGSTRRW